jgi:hypothetical protein
MSILQQKTEHCKFCNKEHKDHTEKLLEIHESTIEKALKTTRHKKLWTMHVGFGSMCKAILSNDFEYDKGYVLTEWLKPIYLSCSECGHYLGSIEEDHADVLDSMCLECFSKLTEEDNENHICVGYCPNPNCYHVSVGYPKESEPVRNIWSGEMVSTEPVESTGRFCF